MRDWPVMKRFLSGALAIASGPSATAAYADDRAARGQQARRDQHLGRAAERAL
jgi:hypothetical protein